MNSHVNFSTSSVFRTLFSPPPAVGSPASFSGTLRPPVWTVDRIIAAFHSVSSALSQRARLEGAAMAALALWPERASALAPELARRTLAVLNGGENPASSISDALLQVALADFDAEQFDKAIMALACVLSLAGTDDATSELGLALCAMRMHRLREAGILASHCVLLDPKNFRAQCIAGSCLLEAGDRKAAQSHFAMAARLARHDPGAREEVRVAQQMLLSLHFSPEG